MVCNENIRKWIYPKYQLQNIEHALRKIITKFLVNTEKSIMVGDSTSDYEASILNKVPFILRKTHLNKDLQNKLNTLMMQNYK